MIDNPYASPAGQEEVKFWPTIFKAVELLFEVIATPGAVAMVVLAWPVIFLILFCIELRYYGWPRSIIEATSFVLELWWMFAMSGLAWCGCVYLWVSFA